MGRNLVIAEMSLGMRGQGGADFAVGSKSAAFLQENATCSVSCHQCGEIARGNDSGGFVSLER